MRIAVLASGSGTILDAALADGIAVEVVVVDRPCGATAVAERHGVPCKLVERTSYGADFDRVAYTDRVIDALDAAGAELAEDLGGNPAGGRLVACGGAHRRARLRQRNHPRRGPG